MCDEFCEFFIKYSIIDKLTDEENYKLLCCLALFHSYMQYLKKPDEKMKTLWNLKIKPDLLKKYPTQKNGIFNVNADIELLINQIDKMNINQNEINESDIIQNEINKSDITQNEINESDNSNIKSKLPHIRNNTVYICSKHSIRNSNKYKNHRRIPSDLTIDKDSSNKDNENISKMHSSNLTNIKINFKNNLQKEEPNKIVSNNSNNIMEKDSSNNISLKNDNKQKVNFFEDIEKEFNIIYLDIKRNNSIDEKKSRSLTLYKKYDPYKYVNQETDDNYNNNENNKKDIILSEPEKNEKNVKELSSNYIDEDETENTIKYKNKELKMITLDLMLKNIILNDFLEKNINYLYFFSQQVFCFIPIEILFQKIINCYDYYIKLNTPFVNIKKLIYFLNQIIVEMYEYFHLVPFEKIESIKEFYINLENDLKIKIGLSNKEEETNENNDDKNNIKDEHEILEEIKYIISLFEYEQPNNDLIINIKSNIYFFRLKFTLYDSKVKKKVKNIKRLSSGKIKTQLRSSQILNKNKKLDKNYFSILDWEPNVIGEVLIYISKKELIKIERSELYKAIFLKKSKFKTCPNVMACITRFNNLASFIMEDILSYDFPKLRAKIYEAWVKVAEYLKFRKDHNDCVAIYSALHHYIISGLKLTLKEVKTKTKNLFKEISEYCTFEGNYKNLREEIINCLNFNEFYIPYLGMLLKDISYYEANYKYLIDGNLINFEKIEKLQTSINNFFSFKNIPDVYIKNYEFPDELCCFNNLEIISEDELDILANKLEPKFILSDIQGNEKRITKNDKKYFEIQESGQIN